MSIEDLNYYNDARVCTRAESPTLFMEDGSEVLLPTRWDVCPVCDGKGTHVNPSIDCGGLNSEDFDRDPDFAIDYLSGAYDITCNLCGGRTTVEVVDRRACTEEQLAEYDIQMEEERASEAEHRAELAMGC